MQLDVRANVKEVLSLLDETQKVIVPRATARAINKVMTTINAQAARDIKKDIGGKLAISDIKAGLTKTKATPKKLYASLYAKGWRIPLITIDPRAAQDTAGVSYKTGKGRRHIPHAFIAHMKSGHKGVFKRKGKPRLPIQELHGPSIPKVFANEIIMQALLRVAKERWAKVFSHELHFELSKLR